MGDRSVAASQIVDELDIRVNEGHGLPVAGLLIVKTVYPTGETGLIIGTSSTQTWVDNIGLVRAAEIIIQNDMMMHTAATLDEDESD